MKSITRRLRGFSLVELLTVVAIVGILAAVAGPIYMNYVRKSRTAEAISNLGTIALYEETFFAESTSYVTAAPNPATVPSSANPGGRLNFNASIAGWNLLGRVIPDGTPLYFQYEVRAGQFGAGSPPASTSGGTGGLVTYDSTKVPGGTDCTPANNALSASSLGIPMIEHSNWFYATAVGNQKGGSGGCSLFVKVIDRPDIYRERETE